VFLDAACLILASRLKTIVKGDCSINVLSGYSLDCFAESAIRRCDKTTAHHRSRHALCAFLGGWDDDRVAHAIPSDSDGWGVFSGVGWSFSIDDNNFIMFVADASVGAGSDGIVFIDVCSKSHDDFLGLRVGYNRYIFYCLSPEELTAHVICETVGFIVIIKRFTIAACDVRIDFGKFVCVEIIQPIVND